MKVRTPLLYFIFTLLFVLTFTALIWPFIHLEDKIRDYALNYIDDYYKGEVYIRSVELGWFSLSFDGVEFYDSDERYAVQLDEVHIRYNPFKYFTGGFNPFSTITSVSIQRPNFDLRLFGDGQKSESKLDSLALNWENIRKLPDYVWLRQIDINGARLRLITNPTRSILVFNNLDGRLISEKAGHYAGLLMIPNDETASAARLEMKVDAGEEFLRSRFTANLNDITVGSQYGMPDSICILLDSLDTRFDFNIEGNKDFLNGFINIYTISTVKNAQTLIRGDSIKVLVDDWRLTVRPTRFTGLQGNWTMQATTPDLRQPKLDLRVSAYSQDCSNLPADLGISDWVTLSGQYNVQIIASGSLFRPKVRLSSKVENATIQNRTLDNIRLTGKWENNELDIEEFSFQTQEGEVVSRSKVTPNFKDGIYSGTFSWEGILPSLKEALPGKLDAQFSAEKKLYSVWGSWQPDSVGAPPISMLMEYFPPEGRLTAELSTAGGLSYSNLVVTDLGKTPHFSLKVDNPIPIFQTIFPGFKNEQTDAMYLTGNFEGTPDSLTSKFELLYPPAGSRFQFDGTAHIASNRDVTYVGDLVFQQANTAPLLGEVEMDYHDGQLTLHDLVLDDAITLKGMFDLKKQQLGMTELIISNWDISRGLTFLFPDFAEHVAGIIDGRLEIYGPVKSPNMMLNLYASRGRYKGQSDFWGVLAARFEDNVVHLEELNVGQSLASLMTAEGSIDTKKKLIDVNFVSDRADVADVLKLTGGNPLRVSGPVKFNARIFGDLKDPDISANLKIESGKIDKIPIQSLKAIAEKSESTNNQLKLLDLQLVQDQDLAISGEGLLPFMGTPLDLRASLTGNILKIPHLIENSILESSGNGKVEVHLKSSESGLNFENARFTLNGGHMRFSDVVNEINNINADFRLEENRVKIYDFSGVVEGQRFKIDNHFNNAADSSSQKHLYFPSINLDLGIITLNTQGRGVFATIPSLMVKGSMGYFRFEGRQSGEQFTIAGPIDNLHLDGTIYVSKTIVTYPFISTGKEPSAFVRGFLATLSAATWNIQVIPERDNRYVREIKSESEYQLLEGMSDLFTTVDVDLTVDPALSSLQILGIIDAESFRMLGSLVSNRGSIDYLDLNFKVDRFTVEFDEHDPLPWVEGRGEAVYLDSLGQTHDVFLTMYVIDPVTGEREKRGRWGDVVFVLEDEAGNSQEQILAAMGYSPGQFTDKFTELSGELVSNAVLRRWIRPIERELESWLKVDFIRLEPTIAQHLFETEVLGVQPGATSNISWGSYYLSDSQLSIGKYFTDDMFIIYTGVYESAIDAQNERRSGFLHRWSLEYRLRPISRNLVLELGYEYDSLEQLRDRDVNLRYWILF